MKHVTDLKGVFASGMRCGIKQSKPDLAYIYLPTGYSCAGTFTQNSFRAACVDWTESVIRKGKVKALVVNSGNANAATGKKGVKNVHRTAKRAAKLLGIKPNEVAVASTGIIGVELEIDKIEKGLDRMLKNASKREGKKAARAIMTTDTHPKEIARSRRIGGQTIRIAGMAKGAGMFAPNMATMLSFIATDARISSRDLQRMLSASVDKSFNMGSIDGDTSTNDMVLLFSTGEKKINLKSKKELELYQELLDEVCIELTKLIVSDGEGAEKLLEVTIRGAASTKDARAIAKSIVNSPLVKTAVHGADPNWGRVLAAAGKTVGVKVRPEKLDLWFGPHKLVSKGTPIAFSRAPLVSMLRRPEVFVTLDLHVGKESATAWGCDLTKGYVESNIQYN